MIPSVAGQPRAKARAHISWAERRSDVDEEEEDDDKGANSSQDSSGEGSPRGNVHAANRNGGRFPRSRTMAGIGQRRESRRAIEVVELKCEHETEAALQDLLGLRLSGSRSVGVFVQSVQCGSIADKDGRIEVGDQLLNVESFSLIGMTPDQVVRVLRSGFSYSTLSVHLTVAHHWADRLQRSIPLETAITVGRGGLLPISQSEGALTAHSLEQGEPQLIQADLPKIDFGKGLASRRPSMPRSLTPLPGVLHSVTPLVEVHRSEVPLPSDSKPRPHTQGAAKISRSGAPSCSDQITTSSDETLRGSCDIDDENMLSSNFTPATISPANSTARFDSILDMYENDSAFAEKSDTLSTLPPRPLTSKRRSTDPQAKRKSSLPVKIGDVPSAESIDRQSPTFLPGALMKSTQLRHRRIASHNESTNESSSATPGNDLARRFSPKTSALKARAWDSDDSLHLPTLEEEDRFNVGKPPKTLHADDIKQFIANAQRKSMLRPKETTNDELPLVSFDQLNRTSPSPTDNNRRQTQSGSSGQSKSSKDSVSSQGSQKLSWQCPVCLDGASRIRRTKRRMMSTACGHVFCSSCVEDVVGKYHMCPTCRMAIRSMQDVHPIFM